MPFIEDLNLPLAYFAFVAFLFGLAMGSFLNVVIHRVPRGEPLVLPRSHCPACRAAVRVLDNVPVLSYLLLRGRCRACGARISPVYPLVELLTAALFALIVYQTGPTWVAGAEMAFVAALLALIFIDAEHHLLPDVITYPAFVLALAVGALRGGWGRSLAPELEIDFSFAFPASDFVPRQAALYGALLLGAAAPGLWLIDRLDAIFDRYCEWEESDEEPPPTETEAETNDESELEAVLEQRRRRAMQAAMILGLLLAAGWAALSLKSHPFVYERAWHGLFKASVGALIGSGTIWFLRAAYFVVRRREGMGLGDVKMMCAVGAFLGWLAGFAVLLVGSVLGAIVGLFVAWRNKHGWQTPLPFGVCLGAAAIIVLIFGTPAQWSLFE